MENLLLNVADMVLTASFINQKQKLAELVPAFGFKVEGTLMTEILLAEVFVGQVVILDFIKKRNLEIQKVDYYVAEVYRLLVDKYNYFFHKEMLVLFETLMQSRYPEYYDVIKKGDTVARPITDVISKNFNINNILFTSMLVDKFTGIITTLSDFLGEVDKKFIIS